MDREAAGLPPRPRTPQEALLELREGNRRFYEHRLRSRTADDIEQIWTRTATSQAPFATVLGCSDSRLAMEIIFDQFIGDLFVIRQAGNVATGPINLGSMEFAQVQLASKLILVLGHAACGAVTAAFNRATPGGNIQAIVDIIAPAIAGTGTLQEAISKNVFAAIETIRTHSPLLRDAESSGAIDIVGGVYDVATGVVDFL